LRDGLPPAQREQVVLEPTLSSENFAFLKEAVLGDVGIGIFPVYAIGLELAAGKLVPLLSDYRVSVFGSRLYMLTLPNRYQTMATRYLLTFLKTELRALWPRLPGVVDEIEGETARADAEGESP
jgi:DNA-binding transcriptional LysR family regulator